VLDASRGDFTAALAHVRAARRLSGDMFIAVQYPPVLAAAEAEVFAWQGRLEESAAAVAEGLTLQGPLTDLRACMLLALGCGSRPTGSPWRWPATIPTRWPTPV